MTDGLNYKTIEDMTIQDEKWNSMFINLILTFIYIVNMNWYIYLYN